MRADVPAPHLEAGPALWSRVRLDTTCAFKEVMETQIRAAEKNKFKLGV